MITIDPAPDATIRHRTEHGSPSTKALAARLNSQLAERGQA